MFADGVGGTRLGWITEVLPHTLAEKVRVRVERGASVMKQALEAEA